MTARAPSLSVVIPAYNAQSLIGCALESLFRQKRRDFEIIVVDDGSHDETAARVLAMRDQAPEEGPTLRLLTQQNTGPSAARNQGIVEARASLIGFLDADDLWAPDKVERHLALMAEHRDVQLSFSGFRFIDEAGADLYEVMLPPREVLTYARLLERNAIHTSTVIARRAAIEKAGGFDTGLRTYEDYDLWLRIAAKEPGAVRAIPASLTSYRRHSVQATKNWRRMHDGWCTVIRRQEETHPEDWARVRALAWGNQLEYCSSLAYNAGQIGDARRLIWQCWRKGGLQMMGRYYTLLMTGICLATYLPRPLQTGLGWAFVSLRKLFGRLSQDEHGESEPYERSQAD